MTLKPSYQAPLDSKINALELLHKALLAEKASSHFTKEIVKSRDQLEDLFAGLRCCLYANVLQSLNSAVDKSQASTVSDQVVEVILKANQVLFELMPDISIYNELEKWVAQLIPVFIENLGSPKVS